MNGWNVFRLNEGWVQQCVLGVSVFLNKMLKYNRIRMCSLSGTCLHQMLGKVRCTHYSSKRITILNASWSLVIFLRLLQSSDNHKATNICLQLRSMYTCRSVCSYGFTHILELWEQYNYLGWKLSWVHQYCIVFVPILKGTQAWKYKPMISPMIAWFHSWSWCHCLGTAVALCIIQSMHRTGAS